MRYQFVILALCLITFACAPKQTEIPTPASMPILDIEMEAAFSDARNTLNLFIEQAGTPHPARTFVAVKTRFFPPDASPQDIWVDNVTYNDGLFHGSMGDDIPSLRLYLGDDVEVKPKDVLDWMIVEDGKLIGGYTIRLAYKRMPPHEKQNFLKTLDYSLDE